MLGAPPGRKGVPCSIDGAASAADDSESRALWLRRAARTTGDQVHGDTAGDEHRSRAGKQPPGHRPAAIGITPAADHVGDRPVRHNANVPER